MTKAPSKRRLDEVDSICGLVTWPFFITFSTHLIITSFAWAVGSRRNTGAPSARPFVFDPAQVPVVLPVEGRPA